MIVKKARGLSLLLVLWLALTAFALADTQSSDKTADNDFVRQMQELFEAQQGSETATNDIVRSLVVQGVKPVPESVSIWTDKNSYTVGSEVRIFFRLPRAAYVYILNVDTRGDIRLVFPNYWDRESYINKAGTHDLPRSSGYNFVVEGSAGREYLLLIASGRRIPLLDRLVSGRGYPLTGSAAATLKEFRSWIRDSQPWAAFSWTSFEVETDRTPWFIPRPQPPVARIQASAEEVEVGTTVSFSAKGSYAPSGTIRSYRWDFDGDGRTDATGEAPRWTYQRPGVYTVRLIVEDNRGTTASTSLRIVVKEPSVLVEISSKPSNRQVYIDGQYVGRTKLKHYLSPGSHEVRISAPSGPDFTGVLNIPSGARSVELTVTF